MLNYMEIYIVNGIGVCLTCILLINKDRKLSQKRPDGRVYSQMLWWAFLLCSVEMVSFAVDGRHFFGARALNTVSNAILMIGGIFFSHLWMSYLDLKIFPDEKDLNKWEHIRYVMTAAIVILDIVNLFVPIFFYIDADNRYGRLSFQTVIYVIVYGRLLLSIFKIWLYRKRSKNYSFFNIILFLIPIFAGSIVQFLNYGIALTWTSCAIAMIILKDGLQSEMSYVDYLSGVYNRQYFNKYIEHEVLHGFDHLIGGIILDVDKFKDINDTYGHHTGDQAIRDIGHILREKIGTVDLVARYGGDEFILITKIPNPRAITHLKQQINEVVEAFNTEHDNPYDLSFSMGTAVFEKDDTVDSFLRRMDEEMYAEKQRHHNRCS